LDKYAVWVDIGGELLNKKMNIAEKLKMIEKVMECYCIVP